LALELPNESSPSESHRFAIKVDVEVSVEELSDAIIAASTHRGAECVTPPFLAAKDGGSRVAALWDEGRRVFPLAQVVRQVYDFTCSSAEAHAFVHGEHSTKPLRAVAAEGLRAYAIAPPPIDPARRLQESVKDQMQTELPIELARRALKLRQGARQKKGQPAETVDECIFNVLIELLAPVLEQPRLKALYSVDRARWSSEVEAAIDPRRAGGWRSPLVSIWLDTPTNTWRLAELSATAMLFSLGYAVVLGDPTNSAAVRRGDGLLALLAAIVLGVRSHDCLYVKTDWAAEVAKAVSEQRRARRAYVWAAAVVFILALASIGTLKQLALAAVGAILRLAILCRRLGVWLGGLGWSSTVGSDGLVGDATRVVGDATREGIMDGVERGRHALRAYLSSLLLHAPRFVGGLQLPADAYQNPEAMLAACDHATGGLHATGFWTSPDHGRVEMCRELLQRRVQGLSIFAEHLVLLVLLPLLLPPMLRSCWRVCRGQLLGETPDAVLGGPATRRALAVLGRLLGLLLAACFLERIVLALAVGMPSCPLIIALGGASLVVGAVQCVMAVKMPVAAPSRPAGAK
jgi:hypothetical protein